MVDRELTIGGPDEPEAKLPAKRQVAYSAQIAEKILLKVADGATLREIATEPGMPTKSTIHRWIMKYPDLAQAWKAARELSASTLEDEALDMANREELCRRQRVRTAPSHARTRRARRQDHPTSL